MKQLIKENRINKRRYEAIDTVILLREKQAVASFDKFNAAREELRLGHVSLASDYRGNRLLNS
jgi:hypothetical protein